MRVLCRECHDFAHALLKRFPEIRKAGKHRQWRMLRWLSSETGNNIDLVLPERVREMLVIHPQVKSTKHGLMEPMDLPVISICKPLPPGPEKQRQFWRKLNQDKNRFSTHMTNQDYLAVAEA